MRRDEGGVRMSAHQAHQGFHQHLELGEIARRSASRGVAPQPKRSLRHPAPEEGADPQRGRAQECPTHRAVKIGARRSSSGMSSLPGDPEPQAEALWIFTPWAPRDGLTQVSRHPPPKPSPSSTRFQFKVWKRIKRLGRLFSKRRHSSRRPRRHSPHPG